MERDTIFYRRNLVVTAAKIQYFFRIGKRFLYFVVAGQIIVCRACCAL